MNIWKIQWSLLFAVKMHDFIWKPSDWIKFSYIYSVSMHAQ